MFHEHVFFIAAIVSCWFSVVLNLINDNDGISEKLLCCCVVMFVGRSIWEEAVSRNQ